MANRKSTRRKRSKSRKILDEDCNIDKQKCEKSSKFKKKDILDLAKKCGVDIYNIKGKEKTRNQLCEDLDVLKNLNTESVYESDSEVEETPIEPVSMLNVPIFKPKYTRDNLNKEKKQNLVDLALELKITKWENKSIKYHNKPQIIDAILDYQEKNKPVEPVSIEPIPIISEPVSIEPIPIISEPAQKVKGLNRKKLQSKTKKELLDMAISLGIKKWEGKSIKSHNKPDIIEALIDFEGEEEVIIEPVIDKNKPTNIMNLIEQKRRELLNILKFKKPTECDPLNNNFCEDTNVCDADKKICISKEEADYKIKNKNLRSININGKRIIGTDSALNALDILSGGVEESKGQEPDFIEETIPVKIVKKPVTKHTLCNTCTFLNEPGTTECIICNSDLNEYEINKIYPEGTEITETDNIPEGTEITDLDTIEDILNKIQTKDDINLQNISQMEKAKKEVLYCLGLLN